MFVDMVPLENARISVIAFGYDGGTQYILKNMSIDNPLDLKKVYLVSDMVEASAIKDKNALKQQVTDATSKSGTNTPLGTALLSAVDLLENNGASDKNACVILLTDGRIAAQQNRYDDKDNAHTAAKTAASHDWPVYTMHLNDGERYGAGSEETTLMRQIAEESGAAMLTLHARTRSQFYEGHADWSAIRRLKERVSIPVVGNGDVTCAADALRMLEETGCDGVAVGRAAQGNPWIFEQIADAMAGRTPRVPTAQEKLDVLLRHARMLAQLKGEAVAVREMRRHVVCYVRGMRDAAMLRAQVNTLLTLEQLEEAVSAFMLGAQQE